jgi:hypothetical protein
MGPTASQPLGIELALIRKCQKSKEAQPVMWLRSKVGSAGSASAGCKIKSSLSLSLEQEINPGDARMPRARRCRASSSRGDGRLSVP